MKNIFRLSAASIVAIAMMSAGTGLDAQTRNSSETSRSTTTRSSSASSSSRNSSGTVSSSQRSSTQQRNSSGTATRSSSSSSRGGSSSSATVQRSSGNDSRSATQTRNTSSATQTINETNKYYLDYDIALIYKKPTPIRITKTNYKNMRITDGFFESPSTLDYNGIYKGYYVEFDAKETKSKTSFPIDNIHKHQIEYIKKVIKHGGIVFLIVRFSTLNKDFVIKGKDLIQYIDNNERKSIPLSYFEENTYKIEIKYAPRLDYIKVIDKIIDEYNNH